MMLIYEPSGANRFKHGCSRNTIWSPVPNPQFWEMGGGGVEAFFLISSQFFYEEQSIAVEKKLFIRGFSRHYFIHAQS